MNPLLPAVCKIIYDKEFVEVQNFEPAAGTAARINNSAAGLVVLHKKSCSLITASCWSRE